MFGIGKKKSKEKEDESPKEDRKEDVKKEDKKRAQETLRSKSKVSVKDEKKEDGSKVTTKKSSHDLSKELPHDSTPEESFGFPRIVNHSLYSDVLFHVGQPPNKVYAHACIIEVRCPALLKNAKKKKNVNEVDIVSSVNLPTFLELIKYLYTNSIDLGSMDDAELLLLLSATSKYEGLERLQWLVERQLKKLLNLENSHKILKAAAGLELESYKEYVLRWAVEHYAAFVSEKQATKDLGIELFQEVVSLYQEHQAKGLPALPEKTEPADTFLDDFKAVFDAVKLSDITFKLNEANAMGFSGTQIRAHKAVVVGRAPGLSAILNQTPVEVSKGLFAVLIKGISPEAFEAVLRWIYYDETKIPTLTCCELIPFCQQYSLFPLEKACVTNLANGIQLETVLTILDVSYLQEMPEWFNKEMQELRPKAVAFAGEHLKELDLEKIRSKKLHRDIAPDILDYLQKQSKKE